MKKPADRKVKVNKYARQIEAELDLHGYTGDEAIAAIKEFIASSRAKSAKRVRLIVGKGLHSSGRPVLGEIARNCLKRLGIACKEAKINEGGEGAIIVDL